jgi:hypothetical protein
MLPMRFGLRASVGTPTRAMVRSWSECSVVMVSGTLERYVVLGFGPMGPRQTVGQLTGRGTCSHLSLPWGAVVTPGGSHSAPAAGPASPRAANHGTAGAHQAVHVMGPTDASQLESSLTAKHRRIFEARHVTLTAGLPMVSGFAPLPADRVESTPRDRLSGPRRCACRHPSRHSAPMHQRRGRSWH